MKGKGFVTHKNPASKYEGLITYGNRDILLPKDALIPSTLEERYKMIIKKRPHLFSQVPQHQLASYLGMTPESLSKIKKRVNNEDSR